MNTQLASQDTLQEPQISLRMKLAALWTSFMFLYQYVDYFHLFMPGTLADLAAGKVFVFKVTQTFVLTALASVTIPALMIFLSVALPAITNRRTNTIIASIYIPFTLFNLTGEAWMHMVFGATVEFVILCLIIRYARRLSETGT